MIQVNLEYLGRVVFNSEGLLYPDSLVGTDSHTTMINGLGIAGWGERYIQYICTYICWIQYYTSTYVEYMYYVQCLYRIWNLLDGVSCVYIHMYTYM